MGVVVLVSLCALRRALLVLFHALEMIPRLLETLLSPLDLARLLGRLRPAAKRLELLLATLDGALGVLASEARRFEVMFGT